MATWGYWRTSTTEQSSERQKQSLKEAGCDRSMETRSRAPLPMERDPNSPSAGWTPWRRHLVIHELDRLGRSMVEMLVQVNHLIERGVAIKTLDGRLDTASMLEELVKLLSAWWLPPRWNWSRSRRHRWGQRGRQEQRSEVRQEEELHATTGSSSDGDAPKRRRVRNHASAMGMTDSMVYGSSQQRNYWHEVPSNPSPCPLPAIAVPKWMGQRTNPDAVIQIGEVSPIGILSGPHMARQGDSYLADGATKWIWI